MHHQLDLAELPATVRAALDAVESEVRAGWPELAEEAGTYPAAVLYLARRLAVVAFEYGKESAHV